MSFHVRIQIDDSNFLHRFNTLLQEIPRELQDKLSERIADETVATMKSQVPVKTGYLRDSIGKSRVGRHDWLVYPLAWYAAYPNYGVRPHMIYPRSHTRLKFYWERIGRTVYPSVVSHPGQTQNPYIARTYRIMYQRVPELIRDAWNRIRARMT